MELFTTESLFSGDTASTSTNSQSLLNTDVSSSPATSTILMETSQFLFTTDISENVTGTVAANDGGENVYPIQPGKATFEVPYFISILIFGVVVNLMVVAVYAQKKFRSSNAALHILNLAAGDIMMLCFAVGFHISEYYPHTWYVLWRTDIQCILHRFARFVGFNITIFEMMGIAIDRYLAVCFPLKFKVYCTPERTKLKIAGLWLLAVITAIPIVVNFATKYGLAQFNVNYVGKTPFACRVASGWPAWFYDFKIIYMSVVLFFIPIVITAIIYIIIVVYVRRNNQKFAKITNKDNKNLRSHWKTARTLGTVYAVYASCYVLFATYTLVQKYRPGAVAPYVKNLGLLLPYANSCMNPVVYSIVNPRFRRDFIALFTCKSVAPGGANAKKQQKQGGNKHKKQKRQQQQPPQQQQQKQQQQQQQQQGGDGKSGSTSEGEALHQDATSSFASSDTGSTSRNTKSTDAPSSVKGSVVHVVAEEDDQGGVDNPAMVEDEEDEVVPV